MTIRTYSELLEYTDFFDRFEYLKLGGTVGRSTFGFDKWMVNEFYRSHEWRSLRHHVIARDNGCDLGVPDHDIQGKLLIHHINPISRDDIVAGLHWILDPEYLITTCHDTHNAIHYGDASLLPHPFVERVPGDTRLW